MNSDFPFLYVCDLLEDLERLWNPEKGPPLLHTDKVARTSARFIGWLKSHCNELNACNAEDDPVSRMLRPESSTDRINGMNAEKLEHVIARVLMLPRVQVVELQKWRHSSLDGDLAACVERVVGIMNFDYPTRGLTKPLTVQEIDQALLRVSAFNEKSSPAVRSLAPHILKRPDVEPGDVKRNDLREFEDLYQRIQPRDGKWLTRLILKSYAPIEIPYATQILSNYSGLPNMINLRAELNQPKPVPHLRNGYCGWIRGRDPTEAMNNPLPTPRTTAPEPDPSPIAASAIEILQQPSGTSHSGGAAAISVVAPRCNTPRKRVRDAELISSSAPTATLESEAPSKKPRNGGSISLAPNILTPLSSNCPPQRSRSRRSASATQSETPLRSTSQKRARDDVLIPLSKVAINSKSSLCRLPRSKSRVSLSCASVASMVTSGSGVCVLTHHVCPLTNCIFLLASSIASLPLLIQRLLPWHGARYVLTLEAFSSPSIPRRCPRTSKKIRKLVLIESRSTDESVEFMKSIDALELKRPCGKKEWVEVYDYRLLEMVAKVDLGIDKGSGYNPWQNFWIGAV